MSKLLLAAAAWIGIDVVLAVLGIPVWIYSARAPHLASASYWASILLPNLMLFVVPGGPYLVIASGTRRR